MFKVNNKDTKMTQMASLLCLYCELRSYFTPCSSVSNVNLEQANADWDSFKLEHLKPFAFFQIFLHLKCLEESWMHLLSEFLTSRELATLSLYVRIL